jgi:hypothetical protein
MRDSEFVLARDTRVFPLLGNFRGIPQRLATASPVDVLQGGLRGQHDFRVFDATLARVVKDLPARQIGNPFARSVRCGSGG